jgi:hypothetical protein
MTFPFSPEFVIIFVVAWILLILLVEFLAGWPDLKRAYQSQVPFAGRIRRFQTARIGLVTYGSCLVLGSNPEGIYLTVLLPFRVGAKPVFVPWRDITVNSVRVFALKYIKFNLRQAPRASLVVSRGLAEKLLTERPSSVSLSGAV